MAVYLGWAAVSVDDKLDVSDFLYYIYSCMCGNPKK